MTVSFVVPILIGVTAAMAAALAVAGFSRRCRAATRHTLLMAAFAVALVLPAASAIAPFFTIRVPLRAPTVIANAVAPFTAEPPSETATPAPAASGARSIGQRAGSVPLVPVLQAIWCLGFVLFLAPVAMGLLQLRSLGRRGLPWPHGRKLADRLAVSVGLRRRVEIMLHESVPGPMTYGTLRPTIVMPVGAEVWTDEALTRALVHELEHIRRADWLTQCLARTVCAAYWFHPLVWVARRRLELEAERASDDAVLRYAEAPAYAAQLVDLARRLSAGQQPFLAMANRHDLAARVRALLDGRQARGRARINSIAAVVCIAAALVAVMSPMRIVAGQLERTAPVKFDAASIKPCAADSGPAPGQRAPGSGPPSPGYVYFNCFTLTQLLTTASGVADDRLNGYVRNRPEYDFKAVRGGPSWAAVDRFMVEARSSTVTDRKTLHGPMLLALLEDRFEVKFHRATQEANVYALRVAPGGLKLQPLAPGSCVEFDPFNPPAAGAADSENKRPCGRLISRQPFKAAAAKIGRPPLLTGFALADHLSRIMDLVVVDQTGLDGWYDVEFTFAFDESTTPGLTRGSLPPGVPLPPPSRDGPTIFKALESLGLKLEPTRTPVVYVVIDSVSKLRPN